MKIDALDVFRVGMPLIQPFRTSFGNDDRIESVLVRLRSGSQIGWGEATPWQSPGYSAECAKTAFLMVRDFLAPLVVGHNFPDSTSLQERMKVIKGNPFAKASIDLAWWDLEARIQEVPLYRLLGGKRSSVEVGADFGVLDSIQELLQTIEGAVKAGFPRIKLKYRPGWDLEMIAEVRKEFPDPVIHVDCNSAYTLDDIDSLLALDEFRLAMVEQPLMHDDLIDHATLAKSLKTPICLDESITSAAKARKAIQIGACQWVNIKPGRVGGLTPAVAIHNTCQAAGVPCWVGGMLESALGGHHCMALATLPNFRYAADIFPSNRFYHEDLSLPEIVLDEPGKVHLTETSGCGAEPCMERLEKHLLDRFSYSG
jgi:O-succinylbenzoate synthase